MDNKYEHIKPFRFYCQKVLPLVYDDSLSYYELLCKVVDYLNRVISTVNDLTDDFLALKTLVEEALADMNDKVAELEQYMNDYFDNLDVQDEINNKLDEMSKNGELEALLRPIAMAIINEMISDGTIPEAMKPVITAMFPSLFTEAFNTAFPDKFDEKWNEKFPTEFAESFNRDFAENFPTAFTENFNTAFPTAFTESFNENFPTAFTENFNTTFPTAFTENLNSSGLPIPCKEPWSMPDTTKTYYLYTDTAEKPPFGAGFFTNVDGNWDNINKYDSSTLTSMYGSKSNYTFTDIIDLPANKLVWIYSNTQTVSEIKNIPPLSNKTNIQAYVIRFNFLAPKNSNTTSVWLFMSAKLKTQSETPTPFEMFIGQRTSTNIEWTRIDNSNFAELFNEMFPTEFASEFSATFPENFEASFNEAFPDKFNEYFNTEFLPSFDTAFVTAFNENFYKFFPEEFQKNFETAFPGAFDERFNYSFPTAFTENLNSSGLPIPVSSMSEMTDTHKTYYFEGNIYDKSGEGHKVPTAYFSNASTGSTPAYRGSESPLFVMGSCGRYITGGRYSLSMIPSNRIITATKSQFPGLPGEEKTDIWLIFKMWGDDFLTSAVRNQNAKKVTFAINTQSTSDNSFWYTTLDDPTSTDWIKVNNFTEETFNSLFPTEFSSEFSAMFPENFEASFNEAFPTAFDNRLNTVFTDKFTENFNADFPVQFDLSFNSEFPTAFDERIKNSRAVQTIPEEDLKDENGKATITNISDVPVNKMVYLSGNIVSGLPSTHGNYFVVKLKSNGLQQSTVITKNYALAVQPNGGLLADTTIVWCGTENTDGSYNWQQVNKDNDTVIGELKDSGEFLTVATAPTTVTKLTDFEPNTSVTYTFEANSSIAGLPDNVKTNGGTYTVTNFTGANNNSRVFIMTQAVQESSANPSAYIGTLTIVDTYARVFWSEAIALSNLKSFEV